MPGSSFYEFVHSNSEKALVERFRSIHNLKGLADFFEVPPYHLVWHTYRVADADKYTEFFVSKRSGGQRRILAPTSSLKILQAKLNYVLQRIYKCPKSVHGFVLHKNVYSNAKVHAKKSYVLNVDLKDFFPTLHFGRVRGLFKSRPFNFYSREATVLAQIACFNNHLPQGSPCSPILSNFICMGLDRDLTRLANKYGCTYTRYADDLTFSTNADAFPSELAVQHTEAGRVEVGQPLSELLKKHGLVVHPAKVRLRTRTQRQTVTGLVVNRFPNVKRSYVRHIRAILHSWETQGYAYAREKYFAHHPGAGEGGSLTLVLNGKLAYLAMVKGAKNSTYLGLKTKFERLRAQASEGV